MNNGAVVGRTLVHLTVCVGVRGKRCAFVISADSWANAESFAETFPNRFGYRGNATFSEAVNRCSAMEADAPGAWGVMPAQESR